MDMETQDLKAKSRPFSACSLILVLFLCLAALLCIEVDAVRYSDKHIAVCDPVVLCHAYSDAVAAWINHGLKVTGRVDPVIDGVLSGIGCAGEHSEVITETVGITSVDSSLALLWRVMPGVPPVGANLGGVH